MVAKERRPVADRKCTTLSVSLPLRSPPEQTRLSVCSYSKTKGTERLMRHRSSPTNRSRPVRRSTIGEQRSGHNVGVDHYLVHGPLPEYRGRASRARITPAKTLSGNANDHSQ